MSQQSDTPRTHQAANHKSFHILFLESCNLEIQLTAATNNLAQARIAAKDADDRLEASRQQTTEAWNAAHEWRDKFERVIAIAKQANEVHAKSTENMELLKQVAVSQQTLIDLQRNAIHARDATIADLERRLAEAEADLKHFTPSTHPKWLQD